MSIGFGVTVASGKIHVQYKRFSALMIGFNDVDAVVVRPTMLDFALSCCHMQCFPGPLNIGRLKGNRMHPVDGNVAMSVVGVAMDGEHVLVLSKAKRLDGVFSGVKDCGGRWLFM